LHRDQFRVAGLLAGAGVRGRAEQQRLAGARARCQGAVADGTLLT